MDNLQDILVEQLKDLYSAESQLIDALPKMAEGAESKELKNAFESHLKETKNHLKRLEQIERILDEDLGGHKCKAMVGLIKEGSDVLSEDYESHGLKDVMLVSAAQRVEHYEIAGYGNAIALAKFLKQKDIVALLEETIVEEGNADKTLTKLCESKLFGRCKNDDEIISKGEARI